MGTQIHATENYRRVVELVQSGTIGAGDASLLKARNSRQATNYIRTEYRKGWEL